VKNENLAGGQGKIQVRTLGNHTDQALDLGRFLPHVVLANPGVPRGWPHTGGEDSDGGGFAGAVWAQKAENLSGQNLERKSVEGRDLRLRLLPAFGIGARNKTTGSA
jgi:hypothetical protein